MRICVVGAGYVGLVSAAGFAELGNHVTCADIDARRVAQLSRGEVPIFEPGLDDLVRRNLGAKRLQFSSNVAQALHQCPVSFVAVGTPCREDGAANLSAVFEVADMVGKAAETEKVIILKSTVPVGTNARVRRIVAQAASAVHVVSNPEFLKEGEAVQDFMRPDRIVIGCDGGDDLARATMSRLYRPLQLDRDRMLWMDPASAELTKYISNAMLALRISFMNEVAGLCELVGADVQHVRLGVGSDVRIGPKYLYASPGYGGSCFPKDVQALIETGREHGLELELAVATHRVNQRQKGMLLRKLKRAFENDLRSRRIAVWGIAFKPRTDDIRESPALTLVDGLHAEGAAVVAHDPEARRRAEAYFAGRVQMVDDAYDAVADAEALVLMTEWQEYKSPDFDRLKKLMKRPLLLDGRNIWSGNQLRELGFAYEGIGVKRR